MHTRVEELRGILSAYKQVMEASWPHLHPTMAENSRHWPALGENELAAELAGYVTQSSAGNGSVRVFWKPGRSSCSPGAMSCSLATPGWRVRK